MRELKDAVKFHPRGNEYAILLDYLTVMWRVWVSPPCA